MSSEYKLGILRKAKKEGYFIKCVFVLTIDPQINIVRIKSRVAAGGLYEDCDDRFAFIAGYTDGGAPFGVMWEEVGIDPGLPFEEKVNLYHMQMLG